MRLFSSENVPPGKIVEYVSIFMNGALGLWTWSLGASCSHPILWEYSGINRTELIGLCIMFLSILQYIGLYMEKKTVTSSLYRLFGAGAVCFFFWEFAKFSFSQDPYSLNVIVYSIASFTSAWFMFDAVGELRYVLRKKKLQKLSETIIE